MIKYVKAANANTGNEKFDTALNNMQDDFDYVIDGLLMLSRSGANAMNDASMVIEDLQNAISEAISQIADSVNR